MKKLFTGGRRKVVAVMAIALVASLTQVTTSGAAGADTPKRGGNITVGIFDSFPGYCMADNLANSSLMAGRTIYETWVEQRVDGKIVPYLLKSFEHSADYKTWLLTIRDGIKFHDGTDVNATALLLNIQALRGALYINGLLGKTPKSTGKLGTAVGFTANIQDVVAVGAMSVQVTLYQAESDYPESLYASGRFFARAPSQILGADCSTKPVGTGAFKLVSTELTKLVVAANPDYWRKDANGGKLPYLDGITFTFLPDAQPRVSGVKSGALAATMFSSASEAKQIKDLQKNKNLTTIISPMDYYPTIWLNHKIAPFSSKNARLAVSHAMDRAKWLKVRQKGLGMVPDSIVGPNNIMYNKKGYAGFDLAAAKADVVAYKTETGKDLEFSLPYVSASADSTANAVLLQQMWQSAGMKVNLLSQTTAEAIQKAFPMQYQLLPLLLMEGTSTGFIVPFVVSDMSGGNPNHFITQIAKAVPALKGLPIYFGILNISSFKDTVSENLLFAARAEPNMAKKKKLYQQATQQLQEEVHMTNISMLAYSLTYKNLGGVGELPLAAGGQRRLMTNFGIDWTGVWSTK
ncbi:MAG: ABC transporter substrate-binding protein [Actinobacteria bacterium]|nr:ABC transporter substrate-binding protein [Actinomycetota bacterium]